VVEIGGCTNRACSFCQKYTNTSSPITRVSSPIADRFMTVNRIFEYGSSVECNLGHNFSHHIAEASELISQILIG